jgi:hypothetical protein
LVGSVSLSKFKFLSVLCQHLSFEILRSEPVIFYRCITEPSTTLIHLTAPRSETCTYVGWGTSGHCFITKTGKFIQSTHAYFNELKFPCTKNKPMTQKSQLTTSDAPNQSIGGAPSPSSNGIEIEWSHDDDSLISPPIPTGMDPPVTRLRAGSAGLFAPTSVSRSNSPGFTPVTVPYAIPWNPAQSDHSNSDEEQDVVDSPIAIRLRRSNRNRNAAVRLDNVYGHTRGSALEVLIVNATVMSMPLSRHVRVMPVSCHGCVMSMLCQCHFRPCRNPVLSCHATLLLRKLLRVSCRFRGLPGLSLPFSAYACMCPHDPL